MGMKKGKLEVLRTEINSDQIDDAYVETWWDNMSKNWVTQLLTPSTWQIGEAMFSYRKDGARNDHERMVSTAEERIARR